MTRKQITLTRADFLQLLLQHRARALVQIHNAQVICELTTEAIHSLFTGGLFRAFTPPPSPTSKCACSG